MKCLVLAAGYATRLYPLTKDFPKPLLDVNGKSILERLLQDVETISCIDEYIIISNHRFYSHFLQWSLETTLKKPITILDDGSTENENRLGAVKDIQFAIEQQKINDDILVLAGDNLLDFSLKDFVDFFKVKETSCIMCYSESDINVLRRCGVMTPDRDWRVISMVEKPKEPPTHWAIPPFYIYMKQDLPLIKGAITEGCGIDAPGSLVAWLCEYSAIHAWCMSGKRYDVGDLKSYEVIKQIYEENYV